MQHVTPSSLWALHYVMRMADGTACGGTMLSVSALTDHPDLSSSGVPWSSPEKHHHHPELRMWSTPL